MVRALYCIRSHAFALCMLMLYIAKLLHCCKAASEVAIALMLLLRLVCGTRRISARYVTVTARRRTASQCRNPHPPCFLPGCFYFYGQIYLIYIHKVINISNHTYPEYIDLKYLCSTYGFTIFFQIFSFSSRSSHCSSQCHLPSFYITI